jgi:putative membrane protein
VILASLGLAGARICPGSVSLDNTAVRARLCSEGTLCAAFAAGIALCSCALISPFDILDDQLFSAHMVQHLVLLMIAPLLLIFGRPALACLWAFPLPARRDRSRLDQIRLAACRPRTDVSLYWYGYSAVRSSGSGICPAPTAGRSASESVHALEHVCFFVTSLMFWSLVLEPFGRRRLDYGSTLLFVATFGVQTGLLGALLTFAGRPLYAAHISTTASWGLTPLEDQQLAGLIMWIPASLIHSDHARRAVRCLDAHGGAWGNHRRRDPPECDLTEPGSALSIDRPSIDS